MPLLPVLKCSDERKEPGHQEKKGPFFLLSKIRFNIAAAILKAV